MSADKLDLTKLTDEQLIAALTAVYRERALLAALDKRPARKLRTRR